MRPLFTALLVLLFCAFGFAQTSTLPCSANCTLARQQPFTVAYNWVPTALEPDQPDGFRLYRNGVLTNTVPPSALVNGVIAFGFPNGLQGGSYTFNVSAFTTGGEAMSDPIALTVLKGKPAKPTNGRLQ